MNRWTLKAFGVGALIAAFAVIGLARCTPSDRSTESYEDEVSQNALEAELAEAKIAEVSGSSKEGDAHGETQKPSKKDAKKTAKADKATAETKTAKNEKADKPAKTEKAPKAEKVAKAEKAPTAPKAEKAQPVAKADVAAPAAAKTDVTRKPASKGSSVYVVQVGAFRVKENADKLHAKLKTAGYPVTLSTMEHSKNGTLHLVRLEPTNNKGEAQTMADTLHTKENLDSHVISVKDAQ